MAAQGSRQGASPIEQSLIWSAQLLLRRASALQGLTAVQDVLAARDLEPVRPGAGGLQGPCQLWRGREVPQPPGAERHAVLPLTLGPTSLALVSVCLHPRMLLLPVQMLLLIFDFTRQRGRSSACCNGQLGDASIHGLRVSAHISCGGHCRHAPSSLEFLQRLEDRQIFRFCAIPQVTHEPATHCALIALRASCLVDGMPCKEPGSEYPAAFAAHVPGSKHVQSKHCLQTSCLPQANSVIQN